MSRAVSGLNACFDTVPRMWVDVGHRRVPSFRSWGIVGFHLGVLLAIASALVLAVPLGAVLGLCAVSGASFFGWGILRRALTGRESLVLLEHVWVAYGAAAGYAWAAGVAIAPVVDILSVALGPFLLCGRLGCLTVGCCHGTPSSLGPRYGPEHGLPPRLTGRRLFPVQLVEAAGLGLITLTAIVLAPRATGTATIWFLASYAVLRFGCERLRGDPRPRLSRLPVAQAMCVVQAMAAIALDLVWRSPDAGIRSSAVVGAVLLAALLAGLVLSYSRPRTNLVDPAHLDAVWQGVAAARSRGQDPPDRFVTAAGLTVAVSEVVGGWHVSLSHPDDAPLAVALALGGRHIADRRGIVHLFLPGPHAAVLAEAQVGTGAPPPSPSPSSPVASALPAESSPGYFDVHHTRDGLSDTRFDA